MALSPNEDNKVELDCFLKYSVYCCNHQKDNYGLENARQGETILNTLNGLRYSFVCMIGTS